MLGKQIPDFSIPATGEATFRLSDHKGRPVVLYFYPKDNTPGCTTEGEQFRDLHKQFAKLGAVLVGVSRDSIKSHEGFKEKMAFPFPLLSDADEKLCALFDVIKMKNMYGKQVRGILPLPYHTDQGARKLAVDWSRCDGHGLCSAVAPEKRNSPFSMNTARSASFNATFTDCSTTTIVSPVSWI